MSRIYQRKLAGVQDERDVAEEAVAYVRDNWYSKSIFDEAGFIEGRTLHEIMQLVESLDTIFTIRLFAAFEGMLRQHMRQHHPKPAVPEDAGAAFLIDRVAVSQSVRINIPLCDEVHELRKYRNSLMHPDGVRVMEIPFTVTLARLARYVGWLPEPK